MSVPLDLSSAASRGGPGPGTRPNELEATLAYSERQLVYLDHLRHEAGFREHLLIPFNVVLSEAGSDVRTHDSEQFASGFHEHIRGMHELVPIVRSLSASLKETV